MGNLTIGQLTDAVKTALGGSLAFQQVQAGESLTESIPETMLAQVYFERKEFQRTSTDRNTFGGRKGTGDPPVRVQKITLHVDVYARQRSNIGTDVAAVQDAVDAVDVILESQLHKPFFGLPGLEAFTYRAERVVFEYASVKYAGVRFVLELTVM